MDNTIITRYRRGNFAKITCGTIDELAPITHIAFGSGGVDEHGDVIAPAEDQETLKAPIATYPIDGFEIVADGTTVRYTVTIPSEDLPGESISEAALVDADDKICAIKNMMQKGKDEGITFTFVFDDEF